MLTIGILLPGSTLYPSIGIDFLKGIKSCLKYHNYNEVEFKIELISFGFKEEELYKASEKLLVIENADLIIAYIEDIHAQKLSPLFAASEKLLMIVNSGANYPLLNTPNSSHTIFYSLNDSLCCFLTGKFAAKINDSGASFATSFFDGGYKHAHAMANSYMLSGGNIYHNYVSHYKKEEFNTDSLTTFINDNPDINKLLAVYSGDAARYFYKSLTEFQIENQMQWFCSPMMFDSTPGDFEEAKPELPNKIHGYSYWFPELNNEINQAFIKFYMEENSKDANLFSMQGWESSLMVMEYLQQLKETGDTECAIKQLTQLQIKSPRGNVQLNEDRYLLAPVYLLSAENKLHITLEYAIEDTSSSWHEMVTQIPDGPSASWQNTYLCI